MVRATLTMKVEEGHEDAFEAAWREVAAVARSAPGMIRQVLMRSSDEPATFIISSDWESREHFGRFERSPEQDDLTAPLRELRASASMRVDEVVIEIDSD
jgi:heme-degrading monooxygenase HmoA